MYMIHILSDRLYMTTIFASIDISLFSFFQPPLSYFFFSHTQPSRSFKLFSFPFVEINDLSFTKPFSFFFFSLLFLTNSPQFSSSQPHAITEPIICLSFSFLSHFLSHFPTFRWAQVPVSFHIYVDVISFHPNILLLFLFSL